APHQNHIHFPLAQIIQEQIQRRTILLRSALAFVPVQDLFPATASAVFPKLSLLHVRFLLRRRAPYIDRRHFLVAHGFLPTRLFNFFRPLALAHLALAAFRAIFRRSSGDKFSILALTDLRPIWAKYAESFLSITAPSYHAQPLSIKSAPTAASSMFFHPTPVIRDINSTS